MKSKLVLLVVFLICSQCRILRVDPEVETLLQSLLQNCQFKIESSLLVRNSCKNQSEQKFRSYIQKKGIAHILPTVAILFNSQEKKVSSIATYVLHRYVKDELHSLKEQPSRVERSVVEALLEGLKKNQNTFVIYSVPAITRLSTIYDLQDTLLSILKSHPNIEVTVEGYRNLMVYGRLKAFTSLQKLANTANLRVQKAVLLAPRNMKNYSTEEKQAVCSWLVQHLAKKELDVAAEAAKTIARKCKGIYLDKLLDRAEELAIVGDLRPPFSFALTNFSFTCKGFLGKQAVGTKQQCDRKEKLKRKIKE
ncbi:MAG: hypothetical protein AAF518_04525 [Spirochaetota bacterium]